VPLAARQIGGYACACSARGGSKASWHSGSRTARQLRFCQLPGTFSRPWTACRWALARARKARLICSGAA